jgi:hypothetical protein
MAKVHQSKYGHAILQPINSAYHGGLEGFNRSTPDDAMNNLCMIGNCQILVHHKTPRVASQGLCSIMLADIAEWFI